MGSGRKPVREVRSPSKCSFKITRAQPKRIFLFRSKLCSRRTWQNLRSSVRLLQRLGFILMVLFVVLLQLLFFFKGFKIDFTFGLLLVLKSLMASSLIQTNGSRKAKLSQPEQCWSAPFKNESLQ